MKTDETNQGSALLRFGTFVPRDLARALLLERATESSQEAPVDFTAPWACHGEDKDVDPPSEELQRTFEVLNAPLDPATVDEEYTETASLLLVARWILTSSEVHGLAESDEPIPLADDLLPVPGVLDAELDAAVRDGIRFILIPVLDPGRTLRLYAAFVANVRRELGHTMARIPIGTRTFLVVDNGAFSLALRRSSDS